MIRNPAHHGVLVNQQHGERVPTAPSAPWFVARDIGVAGLVLFLGLISWTLPERRWRKVAEALASDRLRRSPGLDTDQLETIRVVVGDRPAPWIEQNFRKPWLAHKYHAWMQLLACYWPKRWQPTPELIGGQHLDVALARGRGVLLLTANFAYQDLMSKAAFARAGYGINHLSRDTHGFFEGKLAQRLLNPIYTRIEKRYLKERMVFSEDRTKSVNARIKAKLRDNEPVMVLVTPLGRKVTVLPFMHGQIRIATGALNFACETGATVLPVFTVRQPNGRIQTFVESGLKRPKYQTRRETIEAMLLDYLPRLERYVRDFPDQFAFPASSDHGEALIQPTPPEVAMPKLSHPATERRKVADHA